VPQIRYQSREKGWGGGETEKQGDRKRKRGGEGVTRLAKISTADKGFSLKQQIIEHVFLKNQQHKLKVWRLQKDIYVEYTISVKPYKLNTHTQ